MIKDRVLLSMCIVVATAILLSVAIVYFNYPEEKVESGVELLPECIPDLADCDKYCEP